MLGFLRAMDERYKRVHGNTDRWYAFLFMEHLEKLFRSCVFSLFSVILNKNFLESHMRDLTVIGCDGKTFAYMLVRPESTVKRVLDMYHANSASQYWPPFTSHIAIDFYWGARDNEFQYEVNWENPPWKPAEDMVFYNGKLLHNAQYMASVFEGEKLCILYVVPRPGLEPHGL